MLDRFMIRPDPEGFYEDIPPNMWRNGVRALDQATFDRIIAAADQPLAIATAAVQSALLGPTEAADLIIPRGRSRAGGGSGVSYRKSKQAKVVGDFAEDLVVRFLEGLGGCAEIVHRAAGRDSGVGYRLSRPGWSPASCRGERYDGRGLLDHRPDRQ